MKSSENTLGPRGPFLQRGVDVVSQLVQRWSSRVSLPLETPRREQGKALYGDVLEVSEKLEIEEEADPLFFSSFSESRVEGVPKERVQSTEEEEEEEDE